MTEHRSVAALVGFLLWVMCWFLGDRFRRYEVPIYVAGVTALLIGLMLTERHP